MPLESWIQHSRVNEFLYDWQTLIAGGLALSAGILTVLGTMFIANKQMTAAREEADRVIAASRDQTETTVRLERERIAREVDAIRKSLAVEIRWQVRGALRVNNALWKMVRSSRTGPITVSMLESELRMTAPIHYLANAGKIALLGTEGAGVVILYALLEGAREIAARHVTGVKAHDHVHSGWIYEIAGQYLAACKDALGLLPKLPTGDPSLDAEDEGLMQEINAAIAAQTPPVTA